MRIIATILFLLFVNLLYPQTGNSPCPRNQPVTAYHTKEKKVFLFGGFCSTEKTRLNDLWKFDGKSWELVETATAPEPRSGHSMIYDPSREGLVIFGGKNNNGELLNDLWLWNGIDWTLISDKGPYPRQSHRIVLNNDNGDIFLFGGSNAKKESLNDSWIFTDGKWAILNAENPPPPRLQHTLVYDRHRKKVVLFGGFDRTESGKLVFGDTWEWSQIEGWTNLDNNEIMARDHHAMVYDMKSKRTILFGGYNDVYLGDTWSWNGQEWKQLASDGPSRAGKPSLMFDSSKKCIILFGGGNSENMYLMDFLQFDSITNSWASYSK